MTTEMGFKMHERRGDTLPNSFILRVGSRLEARNSEPLAQLVIKQAAAGLIRLEPFAIDNELWNGTLANVANHFGRCGRVDIDVDFGERDAVHLQKIFRRPTIAAPSRRVNLNLHRVRLVTSAVTICDHDHR